MRKPLTKWAQPSDRCPQRYRAGSHFAPLRSPGPTRAAKQSTTEQNPIREWLDECAGGGSVTGEPSTPLRGSFQLTLVPRERKRRDSNCGLVITTAVGCGTHVCQHDPPSLTPRLLTQQTIPKSKKKNHENWKENGSARLTVLKPYQRFVSMSEEHLRILIQGLEHRGSVLPVTGPPRYVFGKSYVA